MGAEQFFEKRDRSADAAAKADPIVRPGRESRAQKEEGTVQALPDAQRAKYEATFNVSLGEVRVHTGKYAATLCADVNAAAFARGNDIYLAEGVNPADPKNDRLLAHEVAHTVQQRGAAKGTGPLRVSNGNDALEKEADAAAAAAMKGEAASVSSAPEEAIARKDKDEKEEEPVEVDQFSDAWFSATKFQLQKAGGVNVIDSGDMMLIQSPEIVATSTASLKLPKDQKLGSKTVQVGPIQTLLSSKRTGIYQKDKTETKQTQNMGRIRDAAPVTNKDGKTTFSMKSEKGPFYSGNPNLEIRKQDANEKPENKRAEGDPNRADLGQMAGDSPAAVQVVMIDQPKMAVPKKLPDGSVLIGTEGSDEFNTSAGFKTSNGQTFGKAPFGWRVSWNKKIDIEKPEDAAAKAKADKDPKNDAISTFEQKEAIIEETEVFAVQLANINTLEAAAYRPLEWLVTNLPKAREARPEAAALMEQAIAGKTVTIAVTPRKSAVANASPSAKLNLEITPSIAKMGKTSSVVAMVGQTQQISMTLGSLANAASLSLSDTIGIAGHEWSSGTWSNTQHLGGTVVLPLPVGGKSASGSLEGGDGSYDVSVSIS